MENGIGMCVKDDFTAHPMVSGERDPFGPPMAGDSLKNVAIADSPEKVRLRLGGNCNERSLLWMSRPF
jgi:hypothetical protein